MIPLRVYCAMAWGFTSGTTSGTSGSIRQALEVSIQTAPAPAADGQNSRDPLPPEAKKAISTPSKESCLSSSTITGLPLNSRTAPTLFPLARQVISPTGNSRSARPSSICSPTIPVAPTTATFQCFAIMCSPLKMHGSEKKSAP